MAYLYILKTRKGFYIGSTDDIEERLRRHQSGEVKSTKSQLPVRLVYQAYYPIRGVAQRREYEIKRWKNHQRVLELVRSSRAHGPIV